MDEIVDALKAIAEPTRLRLLALCAQADLTVGELVRILGQSQPRVSRHLRLLGDAGLLSRHQEGAFVYYRPAGPGGAGDLAAKLVQGLPEGDPQLAADRARLEEVRRARASTADSYFRQNAARWDELRSLHVDDALVEAALEKLLPRGQVADLLDIGTGTGRMLQLLAPRAERAVGIDQSREMLAIARNRLDRPELRHCSVRLAEMTRLPFPDASFDVAVCHMVLHYADDPAACIAEAARVLRPKGRLLLVDFASHDRGELAIEHAHRWQGFADADVARWCREAGLGFGAPVALPGSALTVKIWRAEQPIPRTAAPERPTELVAPAAGLPDLFLSSNEARR